MVTTFTNLPVYNYSAIYTLLSCSSVRAMQSLPPELGSLQRLKAINATSNRLQTVPPAILLDCSSLQTLLLHANPISAEVRPSAFLAHNMIAGFRP